MMIDSKIQEIRQKIAQVSRDCGRDPGEITLVGVTKYSPLPIIEEAIRAGLTHIGENRVQNAQEKFTRLDPSLQVTRHMIGHLQTNKVKQALKLFDMIQSVDTWHLAQMLEKEAQKINKTVDVLVEVNTSGEEQKYGMAKNEVLPFLEQALSLKYVRVRGLMTIAALTEDETIVRGCFKTLKQLFDEAGKKFLGSPNVAMTYLSMGMTDDYPWAIEEGANMLRIGRAIFT